LGLRPPFGGGGSDRRKDSKGKRIKHGWGARTHPTDNMAKVNRVHKKITI